MVTTRLTERCNTFSRPTLHLSDTEIQDVKNKAMAAVTATVKDQPLLDVIYAMDGYGSMIDEAVKAQVDVGDKTEGWFVRMLVLTPLFKNGTLKMDWRQVRLAPETLYVPFVMFRATGLELMFDPIEFPTEDDVIQITIALKAGQ